MSRLNQTDTSHIELQQRERTGSQRIQFAIWDVIVLTALLAVAMNGTMELYRTGQTDVDRTSTVNRMIRIGHPDPPPAPVIVVLGGDLRFTEFWFRRFATCVVSGCLLILTAFFFTALAATESSEHVRRAAPRLAAGIACLAFAGCVSSLTYLVGPHIKIDGRWVGEAARAGWWAVGSAAAALGVIVGVERWLVAQSRRRSSSVQAVRSNR